MKKKEEQTESDTPSQLSLFEDLFGEKEEPPPSHPPREEPPRGEVEAPLERSPIEFALAEKRWDELALLTEHSVEKAQRILWIVAQVHLKLMPATVLCAPFEEALEGAAGGTLDKSIAPTVSEAVELLGERLLSNGEKELAISLLTAASKLLNTRPIREKLTSILTEELADAPTKESLLSPQEMQKRLQLLDLKRSLVSRDTGAFELGDPGETLTGQRITPEIQPGGGRRSGILLLSLLFLLASVGGMWWYVAGQRGGVPVGSVRLADSAAPKVSEPRLVTVDPPSHLEALMYDDRLVPTQSPAGSLSGETQRVGPAAQPTVAKVETETPKPTPVAKAKVSLEGPYETKTIEGFLEGRNPRGSRYDDSPVVRERRSDDAREARERDSARTPFDDRGDDRGDDRANPDGLDKFEIRINTTVMDRPSFRGRAVADLYVGDRVLVEARIGKWLRIRSQKGAPGYIIGQDAERLR